MIDDSDGPVTHIDIGRYVKARKEHRCNECRRTIRAGERYHNETFLDDNRNIKNHKTCPHCMVARGWLWDECGGWLYGGVREDVLDHWIDKGDIRLARLIVGMRRKWTTRRGALMPMPEMPGVTP